MESLVGRKWFCSGLKQLTAISREPCQKTSAKSTMPMPVRKVSLQNITGLDRLRIIEIFQSVKRFKCLSGGKLIHINFAQIALYFTGRVAK